MREWRLGDEYLKQLVPLVRQRMQRLDEFLPLTDFFFSGDLDYTAVAKDLVPKNRTAKDVTDCLLGFVEVLDVQRDFSHAALEAVTRVYAEKIGWDAKELFMVVRMAVSARKATPPLFETLAVLGRDLTRRRLRLCGDFLKRGR
jgi:glutamyl-tRNA synthetase